MNTNTISLPNYLAIHIGGAPLGHWLDEVMIDIANAGLPPVDRNLLAWELIHICLSFFHLHGLFITQGEFDVLVSLLTYHSSCVGELLGYTNIFYLYSYVVAMFGYLPTSASYSPIVQDAIDALANGDVPQISLPPNPPTASIPYPRSG